MCAYGSTYEELFLHALLGMFQSIGPVVQGCLIKNDRIICENLPKRRRITLKARGYEALLVDFLSEALCFSDIYNEVYLDMTVFLLTPEQIDVTVHGTKIEGFSGPEIKAVTYHDLQIRSSSGQLEADIVFDI